MDQLKLRVYDGVVLAGFLTLPALFCTELSSLAAQNSAAGWLALLLAFAGMTCLFLITTRLTKRYEGMDLIEITSQVLGRPAGAVYAVLLGLYFCFFTGVHIRESAEILKIYGLGLTPLHVVAGLILAAAVAMTCFGGWAIVKSAGFFFVVMVVGVVVVVALGLSRYYPGHLVPLLGRGLPDLTRNGLRMTSLFDGVMALFLFAPAFSDGVSLRRAGVISLAVAAAASIVLFLCYMMMFSKTLAPEMMSGFIEMGKSSYYNHFFYRFEAPLLLFLISSATVGASVGLLIAGKSVACAVGRRPSRGLTLLCVLPALAAMLAPENALDLTAHYLPVVRRYSVFFVAGVPLLAAVVSAGKKGVKA